MLKLKQITKNKILFLTIFLCIVSVLLLPQIAQADFAGGIANFFSWVLGLIIGIVGKLLLIAINILIMVLSFNDFIGANIVRIGWVIIRDVANLGIVIGMLYIAFSTVLDKQNYTYQKMLPALVASAILINFSKSICGFIIDIGQVVMMTFVHAFEGIAAGNLTYGFGLQELLAARGVIQGAGVDINDWSVLGAYVLGVIMVVVALFVIITMIVMLLSRIVTLWVSIIFSPLYFLKPIFPQMSTYVEPMKQKFLSNIIFGPVLAFLFWLSMTVISQVTTQNRIINLEVKSRQSAGTATQADYQYFASKVSSPQRIFDYMVTVALLLMTMATAKDLGAKAGGAVAKASSNMGGRLDKLGAWTQRNTLGRAQQASQKAGKIIGQKSQVVPMVKTLADNVVQSKFGKVVGLNEKYTAEKNEERQTKWDARIGNKKKRAESWGKLMEQRARKKHQENIEKGVYENLKPEDFKKEIETLTDKGKISDAIAMYKQHVRVNGVDGNSRGLLSKLKGKMQAGHLDRLGADYVYSNLDKMTQAKANQTFSSAATREERTTKRIQELENLKGYYGSVEKSSSQDTGEDKVKNIDNSISSLKDTLKKSSYNEAERDKNIRNQKPKIEVVGAGASVPPPHERKA